MVKREIKQIKLKDIFSEWREVRKDDQGLALVTRNGKLRIEVLKKINANCFDRIIFLGEIIKPTMRVGFLNAFLGNYPPEADPPLTGKDKIANLGEIPVPVLSKLKVKKIEEYFDLAEGLRLKASKLEGLVRLKLREV